MAEQKTNKEALDDLYKDMAGEQVVNDDVTAGDDSASNDSNVVVGEPGSNDEPIVDDTIDVDVDDTVDSNVSTDPEKDNDTVVDDDSFDSWLDQDDEPVATTSDTADNTFIELGNELGIKDAAKEAVINEIKRLKEEAKKEPDYSELPEKLKEAVDRVKRGEEYEDLFQTPEGVPDHRNYDDDSLLRNKYAEAFKDNNGNVDVEALNEYMEEFSPVQKKVEALTIRRDMEAYYDNVKQQKESVVIAQRQNADRELRDALSGSDEIHGFKVTPGLKEQIYKGISTGNAAKEMFFKQDGSYDMKKMSEIYFLYRNFDKIKNFLVSRAKNDARKQDFENISNVKPTGRHVQTQVDKTAPKLTGLDMMVEDLMQRNIENTRRADEIIKN